MSEQNKIIYLTPCCKSRHWHFVNQISIPKGIIRCELCQKIQDYEMLLEVQKGYNPITYFCDNCHKSLKELIERYKQ